jgi:hypothetical protein
MEFASLNERHSAAVSQVFPDAVTQVVSEAVTKEVSWVDIEEGGYAPGSEICVEKSCNLSNIF